MTCGYVHGCRCDCKYCDENSEYKKYYNQDPSTSPNAIRTALELIPMIEGKIDKNSWHFYGVRPEAIIARDHRHAVYRELYYQIWIELIKIKDFEKENASDIRNYSDEGGY
jgi:hypothetical protein